MFGDRPSPHILSLAVELPGILPSTKLLGSSSKHCIGCRMVQLVLTSAKCCGLFSSTSSSRQGTWLAETRSRSSLTEAYHCLMTLIFSARLITCDGCGYKNVTSRYTVRKSSCKLNLVFCFLPFLATATPINCDVC